MITRHNLDEDICFAVHHNKPSCGAMLSLSVSASNPRSFYNCMQEYFGNITRNIQEDSTTNWFELHTRQDTSHNALRYEATAGLSITGSSFSPGCQQVIQNGQPRPQGLLGGQNGGLEKTLANNRSRVSKNIGDFNLFNMAEGSVSYSLVKTGNTSNWTLWSVDFIKFLF